MMGADLSVIVTTRNNEATLAACLQSIVDQVAVEVELIVVDNNSSDSTVSIARSFSPTVIDCGPERSAQRNRGALQASTSRILFIDSDMVLTPEVGRQCMEQLGAGARAVVIPEESFGVGFWAACKALERSFYVGLDWVESARCYTYEVLQAVGGWDEELTGGEDMDLHQRTVEQVGRAYIGRTTALICHDEQRLRLGYTLRKKFYYAQQLDHYAGKAANSTLFRRQASPIARYALFFSHPARLFKSPATGLGMLAMKSLEFAAGGLGLLSGRLRQRLSHS